MSSQVSFSLAVMQYNQSPGQGRGLCLWLSFLSIASVRNSSRFGGHGT